MSDCAKYRHLLPYRENEGGSQPRAEALRAHLAACRGCSVENAEIKELVDLGKGLFSGVEQLPGAARTRIAMAAAERSAGSGGWVDRLLSPLLWGRRPGFATALAAAFLIAVVAVPVAVRIGTQPRVEVSDRGHNGPTRIDMTPLSGGGVHLAWSNGERGFYKITKSNDPRGIEGAETHIVRGHDWTDDDPGPSRIVYYRID